MAKLIVLLGLALVVVQGLGSGQFSALLQAAGLQQPQGSSQGPTAGLPPASNAPTLPGVLAPVSGILGRRNRP